MKRIIIMLTACLFLVNSLACQPSFTQCPPPAAVQQIENDISDKTINVIGTTGKNETWRFEKDKKITIVESGCQSNKAQMVVGVRERRYAAPAIAEASGNLRLHYEKVGNDWILKEIENQSFKIDNIFIGSPMK